MKKKLLLGLSLSLAVMSLRVHRRLSRARRCPTTTPSQYRNMSQLQYLSANLYRPNNGVQYPFAERVKEMPVIGETVYREEPIQQFRAWRCSSFDGDMWLHAVFTLYPFWPQYARMEFKCPHLVRNRAMHADPAEREALYRYGGHFRYGDHPKDKLYPVWQCTCGIWSTDKMEHVALPNDHLSVTEHGCYVVGTIRCWGRHVRHERGYRSQYAYPERLFIVAPNRDVIDTEAAKRIQRKLTEAYGVPVGFCCYSDLKALGEALRD